MHHAGRNQQLLYAEGFSDASHAVAPQPSRLDRVRASLDQSALDRRIAAGAATADDGRLTARAWQLTRPRTRRHLADALERVIHDSDDMQHHGNAEVRAAHRDIRATRGELAQLAARLRDDLPVQAAGVARVSLLVADGNGPLYVAARDRNGLWREVHAAREALG